MRARTAIVWLGLAAALNGCAFASLGPVTRDGRPTDSVDSTLVRVERASAPLEVRAGLKLEKGDIIETSDDATAVLVFSGGGRAALQPRTRVQISSIFTFFGKVFLSGKLRARTSNTDYAAEGTAYSLAVETSGREDLRVVEGRVRVSRAGDSVLVQQGEGLLSDARGLGRVRALTPQELDEVLQEKNRADPDDLRVPDVRRLAPDRAERKLSDFGLSASRQPRAAAPSDIGLVVDQKPAPGGRASGGEVVLFIGARAVRVPDLTGRTRAEAAAALRSSGLELGDERSEITGKVGVGQVARQSVDPGAEVLAGSSVDVVIEATAAVVPQLVGQDRGEAAQTLERVGLRVGSIRQQLRANSADGRVLRQSPRAGSRVAPGTAVDLDVSQRGVVVPDLQGQDQRTALARLKNSELNGSIAGREPSRLPQGQVIRSEPRSGEVVAPGSSVSITVSSGRGQLVDPGGGRRGGDVPASPTEPKPPR